VPALEYAPIRFRWDPTENLNNG